MEEKVKEKEKESRLCYKPSLFTTVRKLGTRTRARLRQSSQGNYTCVRLIRGDEGEKRGPDLFALTIHKTRKN